MNVQARWIVGVAAATALLAAVWLSKAAGGGVVAYFAYAALVASPLLAPNARAFQKVCRIGALLLLLIGLFGLFWGLFWFWPAALLLILASHADRADGRQARRLATTGTVIGIVAAVGWGAAIYQTALRPPDAYLVIFDSTRSQAGASASGAVLGDGSGIGSGATGVSTSARQWHVYFHSGIKAAQRTALRARLQGLPGVVQVRLCSRWNGEC